MGISDLAIIGAGPAGMSAALQAKRLGLDFTIFEKGCPGGQALAAHWIEDCPGYPQGISGKDLMRKFIKSIEGCRLEKEEIKKLLPLRSAAGAVEKFEVSTRGSVLYFRTVIVACGLVPKRLKIPGEENLWGEKIFGYVDPFRLPHQGKKILVIGGSEAALDQALAFSKKAAVTLALRGSKASGLKTLQQKVYEQGIKILSNHIPVKIKKGEDSVAVYFETINGEGVYVADLIIVCVGKEPDREFLAPMLTLQGTPGLFFAGDCFRLKRERHIAIATGDGLVAALAAENFLKGYAIKK